jgi:hypothetical protein
MTTASYAAVATAIAGWLMVAAGVSKRQLSWRPRKWRRRRWRLRQP